jgi:pimeloyl-ACP methyl ester carboxylesterase
MTNDPITQLYYESSGPEASETIVFLHGGGAGGWMWRRTIAALQAEFHCLAPDLPEQGRNTQNGTGPYTTEGAADRIAAFIASQAHGGKAHVVGLSEGAQVTVALLSRHPEVVNRAVVSSALLRPMRMNLLSSRSAIGLTDRLSMAPFKNNDWWIRLNMQSAAGLPDEYYPDFKRTFQTTTEASLVNMMDSAMRFRLPPGLQRANLPVLVIVGSKEYKEMKASASDLVRSLPQARGMVVSLGPKSSLVKEHNWAVTAPDLFAATVKAWLQDRPLPPELSPLE